MVDYIHDLPGRLRVRSGAWKRNDRAAATVEAMLRAVPGVQSVEFRALTGSVKVLYDPKQVTPAVLLYSLREAGYATPAPARSAIVANAPPPHSHSAAARHSAAATKVAGALALYALEKALERSVLALVAKVI